MSMTITKLSLDQSKKILAKTTSKKCKYCNAELGNEQVHYYPHSTGWKIDGIQYKVWLFVVCPGCGYQWALWKLGFFRS